MFYLVTQAAVSATIIVIVIVIETARRNPGTGALTASLLLISLLGMTWLWHFKHDLARMADHSSATFWYVHPSLPISLLITWLLKRGIGFWPAPITGCMLTMTLYSVMVRAASYIALQLRLLRQYLSLQLMACINV